MQIQIKSITYKGQAHLALDFKYNAALNGLAKTVPGCRFSYSLKQFVYPHKPEVLAQITKTFAPIAEITETEPIEFNKEKDNAPEAWRLREPNPEAQQKMQQFKEWLRSKRYSENTIGTYLDALKAFLKFYNTKAPALITNDDLIKYNNEFILKHKLSASYQNQLVNAVKLFFRIVDGRSINLDMVHRPKKPRLLPNVLSKEEVKHILTAQSNLKHRAMLSLIYSCGLRRSELINLKLTDVDSKRNLLIIRQAKGRKDRMAPLSVKTIGLLREYFAAYKPVTWLFEGQAGNCTYDERSLAHVLKQAVEKAGIKKPVSLHWLRHSYATHLLESGTNLRYIQEILGHASSRTTEIYTHVSRQSLQKVISPFDTL